MKEELQTLKKYLTSLWYDASYEDSDQTKGIPAPGVIKAIPENCARMDLAPYEEMCQLGTKPTFESLVERRSRRKFMEHQALTLLELSYLLFCTQGIKDPQKPNLRVSPSGGAKCSLETYIYVDNVERLESGLYLYLPIENKIARMHSKGLEEFKSCLYSGNYFYSPITFIWTAVPYRLEWKYVERAYKILLLDAGHTCQNLYTACESIGLGTCAVGAYRQKEMDDFLGVDGDSEFAIYCAPVGKPQ